MGKKASILVTLLLLGCASAAPDGTPITREGPLPGDGSLLGTIAEMRDPGSTYKARMAADTAKCVELGFKPGTEAYGNCRLQLEQIRASKRVVVVER